ELAAEYVAAVDRMTVGEFATWHYVHGGRQGQPLSARAKASRLFSARKFFLDCQEWQWIPIRFDPVRSLQTPRAIRAQIGPDPRVIADDVWAKLLWAGLNLSEEDLSRGLWATDGQRQSFYPIEMMRAVTLVWLFAGLRLDEILRLRVGCVRWQAADTPTNGNRVCLLHVPVNKTSTAFTKPVSPLVGEAIQAWEGCRPAQPALLDRKTGECVQILFAFRGRPLGRGYLNHALIPALCAKAGVPIHDARGAITSHRARATIASQLANAHEPMSLLELQQWLGHSSAQSTRAYVRLTPTTLTKAYTDAGYLDRNLRTIQVLLDRDALLAGAPANGQPYLFYDLGHGYCTYDFFDKCPHRMACAKCSFYRPKGSSQAQLLEAKANLQHLLQAIPLTEEERAAVEDGLVAVEKLNAKLADVPTPAGPTPRELLTGNPTIVPVESITTKTLGKD
ncbi:MAG TPA: tyrosine-type recombinase/integrase, partial [Aggregatilineales bacterium]|nr:tyrosine-type recombinase/integrase [Aggregatilineales bacterium]